MIFKYAIDPTVPEPIMLINKHIGFDEEEGEGIMGAEFERELLQFDSMGKQKVKVYINSPGGSVIDGMSIYHSILNSKVPVDTYNVGLAASIAGVIFQAGRKRYMADYAKNMFHDPSGGSKKSLDAFKDSIVTMISTRCKLTKEVVSEIMKRESWIGSKESKELSLCDEVENSSVKNFEFTDMKHAWKEANKILNTAFPKKQANNKMEDFKKINNKLGLNEEASVTATITAIEEIINASTHMSGKLKQMEDAFAAKKAECDDFEKKMNDYKAKMEASEKKAQDAMEEEAENKAKEIVENAVKLGKIRDDAKEAFIKMAKADLAGTKIIIDGIQSVTRTTNLVQATTEQLEKDMFAGPTNAQKEMAKIKNQIDAAKKTK